MPTVKFMPFNKAKDLGAGTSLLAAADESGIYLEGDCAGKGTCGKCRVRITKGEAGAPTEAEKKHLSRTELDDGWALACQRPVGDNLTVEIPSLTDAHGRKTSLTGGVSQLEAEPAIQKVALTLARPSVRDQKADLERLLDAANQEQLLVSPGILAALPALLRSNRYEVTVTHDGRRVISLEPGNTRDQLFGIAFDIGTTTIVGSLINLSNAAVLAVAAVTNPQNVYGADVISRITHATRTEEGLVQLQKKVIDAANRIIGQLLEQTGTARERVYEITAVGNTTMSHLFMGIDPTYLAPAPFIPAYSRALEVEACQLGLNINPHGRVVFLPSIAGYVGSDTVGVILATNMDRRTDNCAAIDIGTNGELVLAAGGRLMACSTAAGPAFEGAEIKHGMRAAAGAIETVNYTEGSLEIKTIDTAQACGICGSGLIDAVAALLKAGLIEPNGRFVNPQENPERIPGQLLGRMRPGPAGYEFILTPAAESATGGDIVLTQGDLRELQLAKGAIYAGLMILLKEANLKFSDLDQVLLAGAFGNYIRKESALAIGLLPAILPEKIIAVGNAAGDGSRMALVSQSIRRRAYGLPAKVEHFELSTRPDFQDIFIDALSFQVGEKI